MYGVADCLFELEHYEETISIAKEMLQLNENDNQGVRYLLITALISTKQFAEAKKILTKNKDDASSHILYSRALVLFHTSKDKKAAEKALFEALASNVFIPALLLTPELIPDGPLPDSYSIGSFEEAIIYCVSNQQCWQSDVDTFKWLMTLCSAHMIAMASSLQQLEKEASRMERELRQNATEGGDNVLDLNFFLNNNR
jgi:tetratricopeptide (TPR) repeat protein